METPTQFENTTPYRANLGNGAELFLPPWFAPRAGRYDLIVHFHGLGKLQESNLEHTKLDAAVVSVNHGVGTDAYGNAFKDPRAFADLVAAAEEEIDKSTRAHGAKLGRIALSAWSAGFVSISKILNDPVNVERIDAVLLADGFFTSFIDEKKHRMNVTPLEKFARIADSASRDEKLFAITHSSIPTSGYPSVTETVAKLLEMTGSAKIPLDTTGPGPMHALYGVDQGSFHVKGYEGVLAGDHIRQITSMGETLWPYLKTRWDRPRLDAAK
ncbi:hypothetical protein [Labilithrix luteola]|uniref:hypothetical protein n=1 Tax=Labilithrix luteola TaxID=1391654 RepID=UPI0011BA6EE6|nr:hypothetical protein [Labilithrix luteola]